MKFNKVFIACLVLLSGLIFVFPFFLDIDRDSMAPIVLPFSIVASLIIVFFSINSLHSSIASRSLIVFVGVATGFGILGKLLDLPAGGSGIFFVVIVCGFALGSRFGLLVGMSSMMTSAVITASIGPWLGYQALAMGIVGFTAGLFTPLFSRLASRNSSRVIVVLISAIAALLGIGYGFVINLWSWPFLDYGHGLSFENSASITTNLTNYVAFYIRTSLWWDLWAAITNAFLMATLGKQLIFALKPAEEFFNPEINFEPTVSN